MFQGTSRHISLMQYISWQIEYIDVDTSFQALGELRAKASVYEVYVLNRMIRQALLWRLSIWCVSVWWTSIYHATQDRHTPQSAGVEKTGKTGSSLPGNFVTWREKIKKYIRETIPHWREIWTSPGGTMIFFFRTPEFIGEKTQKYENRAHKLNWDGWTSSDTNFAITVPVNNWKVTVLNQWRKGT